MSFNEAIAVYLYLQHNQSRTKEENQAFARAWGVIIQYAEPAIRRLG